MENLHNHKMTIYVVAVVIHVVELKQHKNKEVQQKNLFQKR